MEKDNKGKLLGKLRAAKNDVQESNSFKMWHMATIMEALIYIVRRL